MLSVECWALSVEGSGRSSETAQMVSTRTSRREMDLIGTEDSCQLQTKKSHSGNEFRQDDLSKNFRWAGQYLGDSTNTLVPLDDSLIVRVGGWWLVFGS